LALTATVATRIAAQSSADFGEVRRILREGMAKEGAPAAAFAIVRDGAIIWEEAIGWADSASNRRATPDSHSSSRRSTRRSRRRSPPCSSTSIASTSTGP
jgi:CubicO group peptidase (beta-lactamase class C family)